VKPWGGTLVALVGAMTLRLTLGGAFQRYVQPRMEPWLLIAGALLVVLGLITFWQATNEDPDSHQDSHEHDHDDRVDQELEHEHSSRVGWLLLAPVVVLLMVAPPSLGSYGVDRAPQVSVTTGQSTLPPLDDSNGPIPMTLQEYSQRAFDGSAAGATVTLVGFSLGGDDLRIARYQIACCAADAAASVVRVEGAASTPAADTWLRVTGTYAEGDGTPTLAAATVEVIAPPVDPYE